MDFHIYMHLHNWKVVAEQKQQGWYEVFGDRDWDSYKTSRSDMPYFLRNVGHALYGLPDEVPNMSNLDTGYSEGKLEHISKICEMIKKHNVHSNSTHEVFLGIIFLYMKIDVEECSHIPTVVFRVMKDGAGNQGNNVFIDSDCRVYKGWADYLENNKLPNCTYCYPQDGVYYGDDRDQVLVEFGVTPAGSLKRKVLDGIDMAGTAVAVGATLVSAAAMAVPIAGSIMLGTAVSGVVVGAYGIGRNVDTIIDLKKHDQSIGLKDPNARNVWLSLGANTLGMVAAGATKMASMVARSGNVLGRTGRFVVNAAQVSAIAANGINIVNTVFVLRDKSKTDSLTPLDVFQFSASVLFFTNSVVNLKSANTIIRESQQNVLQDFEAKLRSNKHMKAYNRLARNTRSGLDAMHGDAKVIKGIINIGNLDEFFSGVARNQKLFDKFKAKVSFADSGHIAINEDLIVDPSKFAGIDESERSVILETSKQYDVGEISRTLYETTVNPILTENGLPTIDPQSVSKVCNTFGVKSLVDVKVGNRSILSNIQPSDVAFILGLSAKLVSPHIIPTALKIAEKLHLYKLSEFLEFLKFYHGYIQRLLAEMESAYIDMINIAKSWPGFNQAQFDRDNGININREQQFFDIILKLHSVGKKLVDLRRAYNEYLQSRPKRGTTNEQRRRNSLEPFESRLSN